MAPTEQVTGECAKCAKTAEQLSSRLQHCGNCKTKYCSRDCQSKDWPFHKETCGIELDDEGCVIQKMPARVSPGNNHLSGEHMPKQGGNIIRHQADENIAYKLLIEAYRIADEDTRIAEGTLNPSKGSPQPQYVVGHSLKGLDKFLALLEKKPGVLPEWWSAEKRAECHKVAREMYHWSDIKTDVPKEINDYDRFGGPRVRLPLRMFVSFVAGVGTMGNLIFE